MDDWGILTSRAGLIDKELCRLVDRLRAAGYRRTLEVELRLLSVVCNPARYEFSKVFPGFEEKGVVSIIYTFNGNQVLRSSIHNR